MITAISISDSSVAVPRASEPYKIIASTFFPFVLNILFKVGINLVIIELIFSLFSPPI